MRLIDTHSHLNFNAYREDVDAVINRTLKSGVWLINVGSQASTSQRAVELAEKYDVGVYAAVGLHPVHLFSMEVDEGELPFRTRAEVFNPEYYRQLARSKKVVAIGETGLDYFHPPHDERKETVKLKQKEAFKGQIRLARELNLPLIFHCRGSRDEPNDAYLELLEIIKKEKGTRGVIHCFGSNLKIAQAALEQGLYLSFTGIITFKNARELIDVIKEVPLEKILLETDAPYLAPEPYRGQQNEPLFVEFIAKKVAEIKNLDLSTISEITSQNAKKFFNL